MTLTSTPGTQTTRFASKPSRLRCLIRPFRPGDEASIVALLSGTLAELYPGGGEWLARRLRNVAQGRAAAFLAVNGDRVAGAAIVSPKSAVSTKLSTLFVAPECRQYGVGQALLGAAVLHGELVGVHEMYVTVAHHLAEPLAALIEPSGFLPVATEIDRYGPGRHEVVYVRLV